MQHVNTRFQMQSTSGQLIWSLEKSTEHKDDHGLASRSMECTIILISQELLHKGSQNIIPSHCKASALTSSNTSCPRFCALFWLQ